RRPSSTTSARTIAWLASRRTNASVGAPRNDAIVASQPTASRRLVLPCPLSPSTAVSPGGRARSRERYERKSVSQRCSTCTGSRVGGSGALTRLGRSGHPHRHEEVHEVG